MPIDVIVREDAQHAAAAAAEWIARRLTDAVRRRGIASIAFSGGVTPGLLFDELAERGDVPWRSVNVFQVDERVAPDGDPDRNDVQLTERLLSRVGVATRRTHLMPVTSPNLRTASLWYARALGTAPLDVVHLGMGDDGHTASWAPGDPVIDSPRPVDVTAPYRGRVRMTLTPATVNAARSRIILTTGASKASALRSWLDGDRSLPISRVHRTNTVVVADSAASSYPSTAPAVARSRTARSDR